MSRTLKQLTEGVKGMFKRFIRNHPEARVVIDLTFGDELLKAVCRQRSISYSRDYYCDHDYVHHHVLSLENLHGYLTALGLREKDVKLTVSPKSSREVVMTCKLVTVEWDEDDEAWLTPDIARKLVRYSRLTGKRICYSSPMGQKETWDREDAISICVAGSPADDKVGYLPAIFGTELTGSASECFPYSGFGYPILDGKVVIGEAFNSAFYILFNLPELTDEPGALALKIFDRCMKLYFDFLQLPLVERNAYFDSQSEKFSKESRKQYVKQCQRRLRLEEVSTKQSLEETNRMLEELSRKMALLTRQQEFLMGKKTSPKEISAKLNQKLSEEFDQLAKMPGVRSLRVVNGLVSVYTETIFVESKGKLYELGDYRIDLHPEGKIRIVNLRVIELTGQKEYHHPHITRDGDDDGWDNICFGNIRDGVYQLLGTFEYSTLTQMLIAFLHTVNADDSYANIEENGIWREVEGRTVLTVAK